MRRFFRWTGMLNGQGVADVLKRSFAAVRSFMPFHQESVLSEEEESRRHGTDSAIRLVLSNDIGDLDESKLEVFRQLISGVRLAEEVENHIQALQKSSLLTVEETAAAIGKFHGDERVKLMRFLLSLAAAAETPDKRIAELKQIFILAGEDEKSFVDCRKETMRVEERRRRIIGSGAGIAVALVVILVFVLAAVLLRSLIFGLILAYILLPLEKYLERGERKKRGLFYYLFWLLSLPTLPLQKLSERITRHSRSSSEESRLVMELRRERRIITKAVAQTALVVLIAVAGLAVGLTRLTVHYVGDIRNNAKSMPMIAKSSAEHSGPSSEGSEQSPDEDIEAEVQNQSSGSPRADGLTGKDSEKPKKSPTNPKKAETNGKKTKSDKSAIEANFLNFIAWLDARLSGFRSQLEQTPFIRFVLDRVLDFLRDEKSQKELLETILKHSGGMISLTTNILSLLVVFAVDLLLTVFFTLLFLVKLAEFCRDDESAGRQSEYLVRMVFNGSWLPDTNDVTIGEARRILSGIMERLRIWVRGYMTLVLVDATVYTTVFFFLRVPYFPLLGILAGCGILLPYVGPVLSATLTVLVTLALGGNSGLQLMGIIAAYLIYNGIIEQFILYPAVIGDSLGLTTLETIVVVLLGAVIAGLPGMLFSLPAASVLKYLIPQILQYLKMRRAAREEANTANNVSASGASGAERS